MLAGVAVLAEAVAALAATVSKPIEGWRLPDPGSASLQPETLERIPPPRTGSSTPSVHATAVPLEAIRLLVGVRVVFAVTATARLPCIRPLAVRARRHRFDRLHLQLVAAVRALVGSGRDIASDRNRVSHGSSFGWERGSRSRGSEPSTATVPRDGRGVTKSTAGTTCMCSNRRSSRVAASRSTAAHRVACSCRSCCPSS